MPSPGRLKATLRSVAEAAGVHPSTASRALDPSKRYMIANDVIRKVESAAEHLGYRRDSAAASLRTRRSRLVGVLVPDIANPVFSPIISGLSEILGEDGYSILVADTGIDMRRQRQLVDELIGRRVDGLVLASVRHDDAIIDHCQGAGIPVVLVNRADRTGRVSSVVSDDRLGMGLAVEHLVGLGHRRIGHIAGPSNISTGALRREGFESAMRKAGCAVPGGAICEATAYEREAGERAAHVLLDLSPPLTALVAANDLLALGALQAARSRGLRCPDDLSIVGHNDMPLVDLIDPPLTTVRIGPRALGRDAGHLLLTLMNGYDTTKGGNVAKGSDDLVIRHITLQPELVVRKSTARIEPA